MVGFSESYKRQGRGGGFYDRYVENLNKKIIKIGIAYKYQRIEFDEQEFDMKFDQIIVSDWIILKTLDKLYWKFD